MKCRTCLINLKTGCKLPLTTRVPLGKTVQEILNVFIPKMVKSNFIDDCICSHCYFSVEMFSNFIMRCIDVENYFRGEIIKLNPVQQNALKDCDNGNVTDEECPQINDVSKKTNYANLGNKFREQLNDLLKCSQDKDKSKKEVEAPCYEDIQFVKPLKTYSTKKDSPTVSQIEVAQGQNSQSINANSCTSTKSPKQTQDIVDNDVVNKILADYALSDEGDTFDNASDNSEKNHSKAINSTSDIEKTLTIIKDSFIFNSSPCIELGEPDGVVLEPIYGAITKKEKRKVTEARIEVGRNCAISIMVSADLNVNNFLREYSQYNITLMTINSLQENKPKRILLLGKAFWKCPECDKYLATQRTRIKHMKIMHSGHNSRRNKHRKWSKICPVCDQLFGTQVLLENHIINQHKESYLYRCDKCGAKFKRDITYKRHMKNFQLYRDCEIKKCGICSELICREVFLKHTITHRNIRCDFCGIMYLSRDKLERHKAIHHTANTVKQGTDETVKSEEKPRDLELCPICGKLMHPWRSRYHLATHEDRPSFLCEKCPKVFKSKNILAKHISLVHSGSKLFECSLCGVKMKTSSALRSHLKLKHLEEHNHKCPICGEGFTRRDYFKRHMFWHSTSGSDPPNNGRRRKYRYTLSGDPVFPLIPCKYCNLKFNRVNKLRGHLLRSHIRNEKRSRCQYCGMTFANVGNKFRHEKRHENQREFELTCSVCYKRLGSKEELEAHLTKHVDCQKWVCEICGESFPRKYLLQHHMGVDHYDEKTLEQRKTILLSEGLSDVLL